MKVKTESADDVKNRDMANVMGDIEVELEERELKPFSAEYLIEALRRHSNDHAEDERRTTSVYVGIVDHPFGHGRAFVVAPEEDAEQVTIVSGRVWPDEISSK